MTTGLERIHIKGLGSLADVELEPGRLTVLIGPNGSGKTQILLAFKMISLMHRQSLQRFVSDAGGASALLHYGPKRTSEVSLGLVIAAGDGRSRYGARLGFVAGDRLVYREESVGIGLEPSTDSWTHMSSGYLESGLQDWTRDNGGIDNRLPWRSNLEAVHEWVTRLAFFHFHDTSMTSALRIHARSEDDRSLRSDGSNLAAYLARLEQSENTASQKAWRRINQQVRRVCPSVKKLAPTPVNSAGTSVRLDWIDDQDERFGSHQLSDGTLRAIALITALAQPTDQLPRFISIDEPELGLHPAAIGILAELARSVSRHTQILFATQSTAFLDHFAPEEVVVVERQNGATTLKRLDPVALEDWLEDYSVSEIFNKGLIGGRP